MYTNRPTYFAPLKFFSGSFTDDGVAETIYDAESLAQEPGEIEAFGHHFSSRRFDRSITSSFNYGGFYMMGAMRGIPAILNKIIRNRMPFEALYKPHTVLKNEGYDDFG